MKEKHSARTVSNDLNQLFLFGVTVLSEVFPPVSESLVFLLFFQLALFAYSQYDSAVAKTTIIKRARPSACAFVMRPR